MVSHHRTTSFTLDVFLGQGEQLFLGPEEIYFPKNKLFNHIGDTMYEMIKRVPTLVRGKPSRYIWH